MLTDTIYNKGKKILITAIAVSILGSITAAISILVGVRLPEWLFTPFLNEGRIQFGLINLLGGLLTFIWIRENILMKVLYGTITSILIVPIGFTTGIITALLFSSILGTGGAW